MRQTSLVHRRIQLILRAIANLLACQGLGFGRPESSVCVAALAIRDFVYRARVLYGCIPTERFRMFLCRSGGDYHWLQSYSYSRQGDVTFSLCPTKYSAVFSTNIFSPNIHKQSQT